MADCVFCAKRDAEDYDEVTVNGVMRFAPLGPVVPGHTLFVPVVHAEDASEHPSLTGLVFNAAARWARQQSYDYNLITSAGSAATQTVRHLHVHVVPRREHDGLTLPWTGQKR